MFPPGPRHGDNALCVTLLQIICPFCVRAINQDMIGTNRSVTAISDHHDIVNVLTRQPPNFQQFPTVTLVGGASKLRGSEKNELSLSFIFSPGTMERCNNDQYLATLCVVTAGPEDVT